MKLKNILILSSFLMIAHANAYVMNYPSTNLFTNNLYISIGEGVAIPSRDSSSTADSTGVLFFGTFPGVSVFSLPNVRWNNDYTTGFEGNLILGNQFTTNWAAEVEFLYQNFDRDINGSYGWQEVDATTGQIFARNPFQNPATSSSDRAEVYALLTNIRYDWKNCTPWTPYIGGGFGVAWLNSDSKTEHGTLIVDTVTSAGNPLSDTSPTIETSPSLYGTAFAWQFKTGIEYQLNNNFSLGAQYRLFGTTDFKASQSKIISNPGQFGESVFEVHESDIRGLLSNSFDLTLTYRFDVQLPIPPEYIK